MLPWKKFLGRTFGDKKLKYLNPKENIYLGDSSGDDTLIIGIFLEGGNLNVRDLFMSSKGQCFKKQELTLSILCLKHKNLII